MKKSSNLESIVFVVDDDASVQAALRELFESVGLQVEPFASGGAFHSNHPTHELPPARCAVARNERTKVQEELAKAKIHMPIIFSPLWRYSHGGPHHQVRRPRFLYPAVPEPGSSDAVAMALEQDRTRRAKEHSHSTLRERFKLLSEREQDVVARVAAGDLNKQIAANLGVSEVTVKVHRSHAMRKLCVKSVVELVRIADLLGVAAPAKVN
jgi:FixJ family two-component response regulator